MIQVDGTCALFDVDQHHVRAKIANNGRACREGQRRHHNLIARANSTRLGREVQTRRCRVHRDSLDVAAHEGGELLLELARLGTSGEPSGSQHGDRCLDLFLADNRPKTRDRGGSRTWGEHIRWVSARWKSRRCQGPLWAKIPHELNLYAAADRSTPEAMRSMFMSSFSQPVILKLPKLLAPRSLR